MGNYMVVVGNLSEGEIQPLQRYLAKQGMQLECLSPSEAAVRAFRERYVEGATDEEELLTAVLGIQANEIAATLSRAECWWYFNHMPPGRCLCQILDEVGCCLSSFMLQCMPGRDPRCAVMLQNDGRYFNSTGAFLPLP